MLRKVSDLFGYKIRATDDDIGHVNDLYFDSEDWNTGSRFAYSH